MSDTKQPSDPLDFLPKDPSLTFDPTRSRLREEELTGHTTPMSREDHEAVRGLTPLPTMAGNNYEFLAMVGKGGFGEVWEAIQRDLRRVVAVKRLRADRAATAETDPAEAEFFERTFREEAYTAAQLDHPNIVPVHGLVADDAGRPMLSMKLVRGLPWHKVMEQDFSDMEAEDFLAKHLLVLIDVAQAVAFAHSRGIVHRDLKPQQVMIGGYGEVLLMDWGLAVNFDQDLLCESVGEQARGAAPTPAEASNPAGTPGYMAPEQTEPTAENIGPWTDIYLLGGTLFVLLSGRPPRSGTTSRDVYERANLGEVDSLELMAPAGRPIPQDLAELCRRCLLPEIKDRTVTAEEFLNTLKQHLSGARARNESTALTVAMRDRLAAAKGSYQEYGEIIAGLSRAQALWPGNPRLPALRDDTFDGYARAALSRGDLVLARIQGEAVTSEESRRELLSDVSKGEARAAAATRTRRFAVGAAAALLIAIVIVISVSREQVQRRAEAEAKARAQAEELVGFMLGDLRTRLESIGKLEVMDAVSDKVQGYYTNLDEGSLDAGALERKASSISQISSVRRLRSNAAEAIKIGREALRIARSIPEPRGESAISLEIEIANELGDTIAFGGDAAEASKILEAARETARRTWRQGGKHESRLTDAVASNLRKLASIKNSEGKADEAESLLREALATSADVSLHPNDRILMQSRYMVLAELSQVLRLRGELEDAEKLAGEAVTIMASAAKLAPDDDSAVRESAMAHLFYGDVVRKMGRNADALESYSKGVAILEVRAAKDRTNIESQRDVMLCLSRKSSALNGLGRYEEAIKIGNEVIGFAQSISDLHPDNMGSLFELSATFAQSSLYHSNAGRPEESVRLSERSVELLARISANDPNNMDRLRDLGVANSHVAGSLMALGRYQEVLPYAIDALEANIRVCDSDPANTRLMEELADRYLAVGEYLGAIGSNTAPQFFQLASSTRDEIAARQPDNRRFAMMNSDAQATIAAKWVVAGYLRESAALYQRALPELCEFEDQGADLEEAIRVAQSIFGKVLINLGTPEAGLPLLRESAGRGNYAATMGFENEAIANDTVNNLEEIAGVLAFLGRWDEALAAEEVAQAAFLNRRAKYPENRVMKMHLAKSHRRAAEIKLRAGNDAEARSDLRAAAAEIDGLIALGQTGTEYESAMIQGALAEEYLREGKLHEVREALDKARIYLEPPMAVEVPNGLTLQSWANYNLILARCEQLSGNPTSARTALLAALDALGRIRDKDAGYRHLLIPLMRCKALLMLGERDAAQVDVEWLQKAGCRDEEFLRLTNGG